MIIWLVLFLLLAAGLPAVGLAIDPGRVQGSLQVHGRAVSLTHAYAHLHDNTEGLLAYPQALRLLFVDREVPPEALTGISLRLLGQLAREGRVQGLLLCLDPNNQRRFTVTLLYPPATPGGSFLTQRGGRSGRQPRLELQLSSSNRVGVAVASQAVGGADPDKLPDLQYALRGSAPLFHEMPVTAVLVGQKARQSPQMELLRDLAAALARGAFASVERLTTAANQGTWTSLAQKGPAAGYVAKQAAAQLEEARQSLQKVVVRGERAVAICAGRQWFSFMRQGGAWRLDDHGDGTVSCAAPSP